MSKKPQTIAVVGAGISGLICAYELQKAGHKVTVFESNDAVGGRMSTRVKDGWHYDIGAVIFFEKQYVLTRRYLKELGIDHKWKPLKDSQHYMYRKGRLSSLAISNVWSALRFPGLSLWAKLRLFLFFLLVLKRVHNADLFDLSQNIRADDENAYDFSRRWAGREVADYVIDGLTSTYQFHGARELSLEIMYAFFAFMKSDESGYNLSITEGGMSELPEALAKKLNVKLSTAVQKVIATDKGITIKTSHETQTFDLAVLACTADISEKIYSNPGALQKQFLSKVKYASTISVAFILQAKLLEGMSSATFAKVASPNIAYFCHEFTKGKGFVKGNKTIVTVGLHEDVARKILAEKKSDQEIYKLIKTELLKVCSPLRNHADEVIPHDIQRWPAAMPKYYQGYLTEVKEFMVKGQGDQNVFFCGDYLNGPWVEGAIHSAKQVASKVIKN